MRGYEQAFYHCCRCPKAWAKHSSRLRSRKPSPRPQRWSRSVRYAAGLASWMHNGEPDDAVFKVLVTFPMKRIPRGQNFGGLPFDFEELAKQLDKETRENR
jgi:hypothetical protein